MELTYWQGCTHCSPLVVDFSLSANDPGLVKSTKKLSSPLSTKIEPCLMIYLAYKPFSNDNNITMRDR